MVAFRKSFPVLAVTALLLGASTAYAVDNAANTDTHGPTITANLVSPCVDDSAKSSPATVDITAANAASHVGPNVTGAATSQNKQEDFRANAATPGPAVALNGGTADASTIAANFGNQGSASQNHVATATEAAARNGVNAALNTAGASIDVIATGIV